MRVQRRVDQGGSWINPVGVTSEPYDVIGTMATVGRLAPLHTGSAPRAGVRGGLGRFNQRFEEVQ